MRLLEIPKMDSFTAIIRWHNQLTNGPKTIPHDGSLTQFSYKTTKLINKIDECEKFNIQKMMTEKKRNETIFPKLPEPTYIRPEKYIK